MGRTPSEKNMFVFNALNKITNNIDKSGPVELDMDYGHREWNGMLSEYYKKRWEIFIEMMRLNINTPEKLPEIAWKEYNYMFVISKMSDEAQKENFEWEKYMKGFLKV